VSRSVALVPPMLAVPGQLPGAGEDTDWAYEPKWDGVRAVAYVQDGQVRLMSRNDRDITRSYPEITATGPLRSLTAVLDGELVTLDDQGRTSFERLQERMHVTDPASVPGLLTRVPVVYLVFDILQLDQTSAVTVPWTDRRALLDGLALDEPSVKTSPTLDGTGVQVLAASRQNGLEGIIAKRRRSTYQPGRRSPDWRKIKHMRTQEVLVAGWRPGQGRRAGTIGALLLAVHHDGDLQYAGRVGTGFTDAMLADLHHRLTPLERPAPPFSQPPPRAETRDARSVDPVLVGEVAFTEWTSDGRLRHPSWRGLRPDKDPAEITRET
jgi:bifunctional non-homologous end joining protein LigD